MSHFSNNIIEVLGGKGEIPFIAGPATVTLIRPGIELDAVLKSLEIAKKDLIFLESLNETKFLNNVS